MPRYHVIERNGCREALDDECDEESMSNQDPRPARSPALHRLVAANWRGAFVALSCAAGVVIYAVVVGEHYPGEEWLAWPLLSIWGWVLLLQAACLSTGYALLRTAFRLEGPLLQTWLLGHLLGLMVFVLGMYAAGALGWFGTAFAVVWPTLMLATGAPWWWRRVLTEPWWSAPLRVRWYHVAFWAFGAAALGLLYLQSCTPDAINYDASWYHLPIAQDYAREGGIVRFPSDYNRAFPHLTSLVFTWGFLVPTGLPQLQWMTALHLEFFVVLWKLVGVAAVAAWLLRRSHVTAAWVGFFLFPGIFVYDQNIGGSADHFLGYFAAPALLTAGQAWKRFDWRWLTLLGIVLGGALLTKYQAIYLWGGAGAILALRWLHFALGPAILRVAAKAPQSRRLSAGRGRPVPWKRLVWAPVLVVGVALIIAAPHLVKNVLFHGNPMYPFAMKWFPASTPIHEHSALYFQEMYANRPYLPKGEGLARVWNALVLVFTYSFDPHYSHTRGVPVVGSLFTLLTPLLFVVRRPGRLWLGALAGWVGLFAWANTYTSDRYLQGLMTIPIAVTVALLVRGWQLGPVSRLGLSALVGFQVLWGADAFVYSGESRIRSALSLFSSGYDGRRTPERRFDYRSEHRAITEAVPEDAVLLVRNYRTTLGIDRTVYSDIQAWQSFIFYEPLRSPRDLYEMYRSKGITHLLYPQGQRPPETLQAAVLFTDLATNHSGAPKRFGSLVLREMAPDPPPSTPSYRVLVDGMPGVIDGLYQPTDLVVYSRMPAELRRRPEPEARLRGNDLQDLIRRANAVIVGRHASSSTRATLTGFRLAERFPHYSIYTRR